MSLLPNTALIQYGTFRFNETTDTTSLSVVPTYDAAGRTVVHNTYNLTLRTILAGRAVDAAVRNVIRQLTKPAYTFIYAGTGTGVAVNLGGTKDVVWGPKPGKVDIEPLGGGNAVALTWSVSFCIPDCADAKYIGYPAEFNYSLRYDVDEGGYTRRTYSGFIRIPQTRWGGPNDRVVRDTADRMREDISPPLIYGFRRLPGSFTISADKCKLDFEIVDQQFFQNVPPPGCINARLSHTVTCPPMKWRMWTHTISASYELSQFSFYGAARDAFFKVLKDRVLSVMMGVGMQGPRPPNNPGIQRSGQPGQSNLQPIPNDQPNKPTVVPVSFTINEPDAYGKPTAEFSCTYQVVGANLRQMLQASGQFRPMPDSNWNLWVASVGNVLGPRGSAGLVFSPGEDMIVDLCVPSPVEVDMSNRAKPNTGNLMLLPPDTFPEPTPESSWLGWENEIYLESDSGTIPVVTLPKDTQKIVNGSVSAVLGGVLGGNWSGDWSGGAGLPDVPPPFGMPYKLPTDDLFFDPIKPIGPNGGSPQFKKQSCYIHMVGRAARVGFAIPQPFLVAWGKTKLTPANRKDKGEGFWAGGIGDVGVPVFGARWHLRYFCPEVPVGVDLPGTQPPMSNTGP